VQGFVVRRSLIKPFNFACFSTQTKGERKEDKTIYEREEIC
jgi:hypothetical protein